MTATLTRHDTPNGYELRRRIPGLDTLRGFAMVVMTLDHLFILAYMHGAPHGVFFFLRETIGRIAHPLFFGITGYLCSHLDRPPTLKRFTQLAAGAAILTITSSAQPAFGSSPDTLAVTAIACLMLPAVLRYPAVTAALFCVLHETWPMTRIIGPDWTGYDIWYCASLVAIGVLAHRSGAHPPAINLRPLEWLGRRSLSYYVTHLAALTMLSVAIST